jgi:hypothetical protein
MTDRRRPSVVERSAAQPPDRSSVSQAAEADNYLPLKALATYSGLSVRTLRGYLTHPSRPLAYHHVVGKILVRRSDFDKWISAFRVADQSQVDAMVIDTLRGL